MHNIKRIARLKCDFETKFGLPRQSGLNESLTGKIVFEREYRNPDAVRGLENFSHIWLLWLFDVPERDGYSATVRPPRLGGNERVGVFATRSPFRPNPIGLTVARLEKVEIDPSLGPVITVSGIDMMDNTQIIDIKPYIPYADMRTDAQGSFAEEMKGYRLSVSDPENLLSVFPEEKRETLKKTLSLDPRPAYHDDPNRVYGFAYAGYDVRFTVDKDCLTVFEIVKN